MAPREANAHGRCRGFLTIGLLNNSGASNFGNSVVAPESSVYDCFAGCGDQSVIAEPFERAVQGASAKINAPMGELAHFLDDAIAVTLNICHRGEDEKRCIGHTKSRGHRGNYISFADIYQQATNEPENRIDARNQRRLPGFRSADLSHAN